MVGNNLKIVLERLMIFETSINRLFVTGTLLTVLLVLSTDAHTARKNSLFSLAGKSERGPNFFIKSICETGLEIDSKMNNKLSESSKCIDEVLQNTHNMVVSGGPLTLIDVLAYQHEDGCRGKPFRSEQEKQNCLWTNPNWIRKIANIISN